MSYRTHTEVPSFNLRILKRLHSATIVALKRNVTFIMAVTVLSVESRKSVALTVRKL